VVLKGGVNMKLSTASEAISFLRELEEKAAKFYEELSQRYPEGKDVFLSFAKENRKYFNQIQRAYYSVITDAIEGCFAFDLETDDYALDTDLTEDTTYHGAVTKALALEEITIQFYHVAADQSMSLLADVPRNFKIVARKRKDRIQKLKSLV
jgi:rubrerythrin